MGSSGELGGALGGPTYCLGGLERLRGLWGPLGPLIAGVLRDIALRFHGLRGFCTDRILIGFWHGVCKDFGTDCTDFGTDCTDFVRIARILHGFWHGLHGYCTDCTDIARIWARIARILHGFCTDCTDIARIWARIARILHGFWHGLHGYCTDFQQIARILHGFGHGLHGYCTDFGTDCAEPPQAHLRFPRLPSGFRRAAPRLPSFPRAPPRPWRAFQAFEGRAQGRPKASRAPWNLSPLPAQPQSFLRAP